MPEGIVRDPRQNPHREHEFGLIYVSSENKHYKYRKYLDDPSRLCVAGEDIEFEYLHKTEDPTEKIDGIDVYGEVAFVKKLVTKGPVNKRMLKLLNDNQRKKAIEEAIYKDKMPSDVKPKPKKK
jgi:hypothetical protein